MLLVLLFHLNTGVYLFSFFWIGVPMFFVLSGFLITRILLEHRDRKNYYKIFYLRRMLRIFPIYYLLLLFIVVFGYFAHAPLDKGCFYFFYLQNFISMYDQERFAFGLMEHTWSLSVEEFFYLFWPFIIKIMYLKKLEVMCWWIIGIMFLAKLSVCLYFNNLVGIFATNIVGNIDLLLAGSLLASLLPNIDNVKMLNFRRYALCIFALSGLLFLISYYCFSQYHNGTKNVGLQFIFVQIFTPFIFTSLLAFIVTSERNGSMIILNSAILTYIGKISYGLYLFHYVICLIVPSVPYYFKLDFISTFELYVIKVLLSVLISIMSWELFEKRVLVLKNKFIYE